MDKKRDIIKIVDYSKYVAFIAATICVFIFQFIAVEMCITLALSFYVVAFGLMSFSSIMHASELFNASKQGSIVTTMQIKDEDIEEDLDIKKVTKEDIEFVNSKAEKVWAIVGSIFYGIFTIFSFVVLVLY